MPNPRFDQITQADVIRAADAIAAPKEIQKWSAIIRVGQEMREIPVKQLLMTAANLISSGAPPVTPADFIAHFAVRRLRKLGFDVRYYG